MNKKPRIKILCIFISAWCVYENTSSSPVFALGGDDIFPAGTQNKITGMESSQTASGAPSLMLNPANLVLANKNQVYGEIGYLQFTQAYEHPDFDQVRVQIQTPFASLGFVDAEFSEKFKFGFFFFPARTGSEHIPGLPRRIAGSEIALDISTSQQVLKYSVGCAYKLPLDYSVGVSLIHSSETQKIKASLIGNEGNPLIDFSGWNEFDRFIIGARHDFKNPESSATIAYSPALKKTYRGRQKLATDSDYTDPLKVDYEPEVFAIGAGGEVTEGIDAALSINYLRWSEGKNIFRNGLTSSAQKSDLHDVTERGIRINYTAIENYLFSVSYSYLPSPWGDGYYDENNISAEVLGTDIGTPDNVTRNVFGIGGSYKKDNIEAQCSFYYATGTREVSLNGDNPGYYQTEIAAITGSVQWEF